MANSPVNTPLTIALTDDQVQQLKDKITAQLVDTLKGTQADTIISHRPQSQIVRKEVGQSVVVDPEA